MTILPALPAQEGDLALGTALLGGAQTLIWKLTLQLGAAH